MLRFLEGRLINFYKSIINNKSFTMKKTLTLYTSVFIILFFFSACSVTEQEVNNSNDQIPEVTEEVRPPLIKEPIIYDKSQPPPEIHIIEPWKKTQRTLTKEQRFAGVLQAHNGVRLKHGLKPLKWSDKLARYSQQWAEHLGKGRHCQIRHRTGNPPFGENLYRSSSLQWDNGKTEVVAINIKQVVKSWTDEERWFDLKRNRCQPGKKCGHYTQIVWHNTTEVGCAMKVCPDDSQTWVCSYNPKGNYIGVRPY